MGGAYVEISLDDTPMLRRLRESQVRLKQWVAENSGPALNRGTEASVLAQGQETKGFFSGGFTVTIFPSPTNSTSRTPAPMLACHGYPLSASATTSRAA
jgi:hypothetical protein